MDGEHVGLFHGARIDALLRLDRRQRGEAVAIQCGGLEFELGGRFLHLTGEFLFHQMAAAGQEVVGLAHQLGIAGKIDLTGAGAGTAADLIEQARPGAALEEAVGAGADQERALQRRDGAVDGAGGCERPEILSGARLRAAMLEDLRRPMVAGDQDIGKRFVVAQLHVEARPQLLDQIGFEQQRLGLGRGRDDLDRNGSCNHAQDARRQRRVDARIGGKPLADVLRLADIEHVIAGVEHAVDAGRGRRQPHRIFDRGMADRERAFGQDLCGVVRGFLPRFRQAGLIFFLEPGRRRIDTGGAKVRCKVVWRQIRLRALPRFARGF